MFFAVILAVNGQISIADGGTVDLLCGGGEVTFTDSDADGGNYASDEYQIITICPDGGNAIVLRIVVPDVGDQWDVVPSDQMTIYNGDDNTAPVLGTFSSETHPDGFVVSTTIENLSGCMTIEFISDGADQAGGWAGILQCGVAWQPFELDITSDPAAGENDPDYIDVCPGEEVTFTVSGDFPYSSTDGNGYEQTEDNIEYVWSMGDGTIFEGTGLTEVSFAYDLQFGYNIVVAGTDTQGLIVRDTMKVRVSTTPFFGTAVPLDSIICLGTSTEVIGGYVDDSQSAGFEEVEGAFYVGGLSSGQFYLPDGSGEIYEGNLNIVNAPENAVVDDASDIVMVCVNIEHSFLGDLEMAIQCPDGTQIALFDGYGGEGAIIDGTGFGGGGTYLGNALDNDQFNPGEGWDYCFSMDADWGTMEEEFDAGNTTATDLGNAMSEGTYLPQEGFENFVGCPINGEWTLLVADNIGIDDGYVFEWSIILDPSLYPDPEFYQSEIIDAYWDVSPNTISTNDLNIEVMPDTPGYSDYTFVVEDNFGCSWDTTVSVLTVETPVVDAGPDIYLGCVDAQLLGSVNGLSVPTCSDDAGLYTYCYDNNELTTFTYCPDNPGDGVTAMTITFLAGTTEGFFDDITVYDGDSNAAPVLEAGVEGDLTGMTWTATNPDGCITMVLDSDGSSSCASGAQTEWEYEVSCTEGGESYYVEWTLPDNLSDPNILNPLLVDVDSETEFQLTVYPTIESDCVSSDVTTVFVGDLPYAGLDNDSIVCPDAAPVQLFDMILDNPDTGGVWLDSTGNDFDGEFDPLTMGDEVFTYQVGPIECISESFISVDVNDLDISVSNDTTICIGGSADLEISLLNVPLGPVSYIWNSGAYMDQDINVSPGNETEYTAYVDYGVGCQSEAATMTVSYYDPLQVEVSEDEMICLNESINIEALTTEGGLAPYVFTWEGDDGTMLNGDIQTVIPLADTEYCLTLTDQCETPEANDCVVISLDEIVDAAFVADDPDGCYPILVNFDGIAENLNNVTSVIWDFGDGNTSTNVDVAANNYQTYGNFDVSRTIFTSSGCVYTDTIYDYVQAFPRPLASFGEEDNSIAIPNTTFNFYNYSTGNELNYWQFDTLGVSDQVNPSFEFPSNEIGSYVISLFVENEFGCTDSASRTVSVTDEIILFVPNTFTPNDDQTNDILYVNGIDVNESEFHFIIVSRWGDKVYESTDLYGGWNGSYQGSEHYVPDGVYPYRIETRSKTTGDKKVYVGSINVLR